MIRSLAALAAFLTLAACSSVPPKPDQEPGPVACAKATTAGIDPRLGTTQVAVFRTGAPTLIGGQPAQPKDWPASVYARSGNSACSATVIGERTVLIAAHCVGNGGSISFSAGSNAYSAKCSHHPSYRRNATADWALCLTNRTVTGIPFEVLGVSEKLAVGQTVRLTGYGCTSPGGGGGNDGVFRIGNATVRGLPSGTDYDTTTRGGGALCFGDSGGAAYVEKEGGARFIFGVNSRGDIATTSYLSSVYVATFRDWATSWAANSGNVRLCGLHSDAPGCRGVAPLPDLKFSVETKAACVEGTVAPEYEAKKDEIKASVKDALEQF